MRVVISLTGGGKQAALSGYGQYYPKVNDANPELESGAQSIGDAL
jgi:hypothetical protein